MKSGNGQEMQTYQPKSLAPAMPKAETSSSAIAAQSKALVEARYTIACAKSRDLDAVRVKLLKECSRPGFADAAIYRKPIGEEGVEGLSIRFIEAALQLMGNMVIECPVVYDDDEKRIVHVSVLDLETNTGYGAGVTIMKRVERKHLRKDQVALRSRTNSKGYPVYTVEATDDEILNTVNALVSKTIRTQGARLVPKWLQDECEAVCYATIDNKTAADPDAAKRKLFDAFSRIGVTVEDIKAYLQHDGGTLDLKERRDLGGIYNAIRDGETTWREVMDARQPTQEATSETTATPPDKAKGTVGLKARLKSQTAPVKPKAEMHLETPDGHVHPMSQVATEMPPAPLPPNDEVDEHGYSLTGDPEPEP